MVSALRERNKYERLMAARKFAVCDILTGKKYTSVQDYVHDCESIRVMEYGIYLLQEMGLDFGKYKYFMHIESKDGIVSPRLLEDISRFNRFELIGDAKNHIINGCCEQYRKKIIELSVASRDRIATGYELGEYLGAMANAHYIEKNRLRGDTLNILSHHTPFENYRGNNRAIQSVKRLMR